MRNKKLNRARRVNAKGRTNSEARHIRLYHWLLQSPAWSSLSLQARCLLIEVWRRYDGLNNGEISYSVREAAKALHIGKDTANRAFHELEDRGFLKASQRGSFSWKGGTATEWELTAVPCGEQRQASKEFMNWKPKKQNSVPMRGITGPPERDREAILPSPRMSETPLTVLQRGTITQSLGPPERDTYILPARGEGNGNATPHLTVSHEAIQRCVQGFGLAQLGISDWRPESEGVQ